MRSFSFALNSDNILSGLSAPTVLFVAFFVSQDPWL